MTRNVLKVLSFAAICQTALWIGSVDVAAVQSDAAFTSGSSIAGIGVVLDRFSQSGWPKAQAAAASLTQEKSRYLSSQTLYHNLGVANVSSSLNIRKEPKNGGIIVGKLETGGGCEVLEATNGWYKIRSGQVTGYVSGDYLALGADAAAMADQYETFMIKVKAKSLRVRERAGTKTEVLGIIYKGEDYEILSGTGGGWVQIKYKNGSGYVYTPGNASPAYRLPEAVILPARQSSVRQKVVNYAVQFVGNRYQWGGTNPNTGADCSGFVQYVMGHAAGISLNRTSRAQASQGTKVSSSQMQPGDLIFYSGSGVIDHVAMYIGDGKIVHAANSKSGIKISKWNYRNPVEIRRIIK